MALVQINPGRQRVQQPSKLERIMQGLGMAAQITGDVVGTIEGVKTGKAQRKGFAADIKRGEDALELDRRRTQAQEVGAYQVATPEDIEKGIAIEGPEGSIFEGKQVVGTKGGGGLMDLLGLQLKEAQLEKTQTQIDKTRQEMERKEQELVLTPAEKKIDNKFADMYAEYSLSGGVAVADKNITVTKKALENLKQGGNISGPVLGLAPKEFRDVFFSESGDTQDMIESAILSSLRATLGAQFTEKEGDRVLSKTFNPRLPEEVNYQRGITLLNELEGINKSKQDAIKYYEENGTMKGYKFRFYNTADDLLNDIDFDAQQQKDEITEEDIDKMSVEELRERGLL